MRRLWVLQSHRTQDCPRGLELFCYIKSVLTLPAAETIFFVSPPQTHYAAKNGLECLALLPPHPRCDLRHVSLLPVALLYSLLFFELEEGGRGIFLFFSFSALSIVYLHSYLSN